MEQCGIVNNMKEKDGKHDFNQLVWFGKRKTFDQYMGEICYTLDKRVAVGLLLLLYLVLEWSNR